MPTAPFLGNLKRVPRPTVQYNLVIFPLLIAVIIIGWTLKTSMTAHQPTQLLPMCLPEAGSSLELVESDNASTKPNGPLMYIRRSTVRTWDARKFTVVFGVPSLDTKKKRWRRRMMRVTCGHLPNVANTHNNFAGTFLMLFILARHSVGDSAVPKRVLEEAQQWQDVIIHPMYEKVPPEEETACDANPPKIPLEAGVELSRRTMFWFQTALHLFPHVPFFAKGSDDIFLDVPQYLADLGRLPKQRLYWGALGGPNNSLAGKEDGLGPGDFMLGHCFTLGRDVAERLVIYGSFGRLLWSPYNKELESEYIALKMYRDDEMVGHILGLAGYPYVAVVESQSRFQEQPVQNTSFAARPIVARCLTDRQYYLLAGRCISRGLPATPALREKSSKLMFFESNA